MSDSEYFDRRTHETVAENAARMSHFVRVLSGKVSIVAGLSIDADDVIEQLDFIVAQADDDLRAIRWDMQQRIEHVVSRTLDIQTLAKIQAYVERVAS